MRITIPGVLLIFVALAAAQADDTKAVKTDLAGLQGEWTMVSGVADGGPVPDFMLKEAKRVCKDHEITVTMGDELILKAKVTIDPSKKPKTIDFEMTDGPNKGKKQLGIYELEGDTLKSCFAAPEAERPPDFTSKSGDRRTSTTWKRTKKPAE